jgi:hypothetical protein
MAAILIFREKKKLVRALVIVAGLFLVYFILDPSDGLFPKCPFYWLTGYKCPGCGSQRAVHELLHFNITAAFRQNALLVISIPYIILGFVFDYTNLGQLWPGVRKTLYGVRAIILVVVIVIAWWILRNL